MGKTYFSSILREIKKSFGRFVSIIAIVALGVGFLVGILSTTPDMEYSVDRYYDQNNMTDLFIKSTMGLTESDLEAVSALPEVEYLTPATVTDAIMDTNHNEALVTRIYGLPLSDSNDADFVDKLTLVEGRMPQNDSECVISRTAGETSELPIGTVLTVSSENDDYENIGDTYNTLSYTIVGIVSNPFYFSTEKEQSAIGDGKVGAIIYVNESCYALDVYTDFYLTVNGAKELGCFGTAYENYIETLTLKVEGTADTQELARYNELVDSANETLAQAKTEFAQQKETAETELADAAKKIEDGKVEISDAEASLSVGWKEYYAGLAAIAQAEQTLADSEAALLQGETAYAAGVSEMNAAKIQMAQAGIPIGTQFEATEEQLAATRAQLNQGWSELNAAKAELAKNKAILQESLQTLYSGEAQLTQAKADLAEGEAEYANGKAQAEEEFAAAEKEISDAQAQIADIEMPEWYVLDRGSNVTYASYKINVQKVADVAQVFPVFFFLVAALVTLTTMTRMVEEERIQIGTLKALGYSRGAIMNKYLMYCGLATVIGCGIGLACGFQLLPMVLNNAYASTYQLPDFLPQFKWSYALIACSFEIACTVGATFIACNNSMKEKPATLMLPRAPKAGKRILLEKIKPIWSRLSFTYKATARNIFRYKKHLFMSVIGIAGCTALILTGFGLKDSMNDIANTQYEKIFKYDMKIELTSETKDDVLLDFLSDKDSLTLHSESGTLSSPAGTDEIDATIYIPEKIEQLNDYISLRNRKSGEAIVPSGGSVIITEKMASTLGIAAGDTFTLENADKESAEFTVTGITENYVGCYVYMDEALYRQAYGDFSFNTLFVKSGITDTALQDQTIQQVLLSESVSGAQFNAQIKKSYDNLLTSLSYIVIVLIIAAGALAVVVLYNLTNININERIKELATLRVLGYHHKEVALYIFRETAILSVMGATVGLGLGVLLQRYIITTAETVDLMFGRTISPVSFLLSVVATLAFSAVVDLMMLKKIKKVEMVESMKAVD